MMTVLDKNVTRWSRLEVVFWSLMIGCGETYISAYALACGFSERYSGLISVIPLALASVLQLFSGYLLRYFKTRRLFVSFCATAQAITLFLVMGHDVFDRASPVLLILVLTLYWFFGLSAGPAWNAWIVSIIPKDARTKFFADRGPYHEISVLVALVAAGFFLKNSEDVLLAFAILFVSAGVFRLMSAITMLRLPDKIPKVDEVGQLAAATDRPGFFKWIRQRRVYVLLFLLGVFNVGVYSGSPFFTPFMLKQMKLNYEIYMFLIAVPFISRAISYPYYEKVARKFGLFKILLPCMLMISLVPFLWAKFPHVIYIFFFQVFSGLAWAGFEYSILLRQLSEFPANERSRVLTWTNLIVGICSIVGVSIGSELLGPNPSMATYRGLFEFSALLRGFAILAVFAVDWRVSAKLISRLYFRTLGVRVNRGGVTKPILYLDDK